MKTSEEYKAILLDLISAATFKLDNYNIIPTVNYTNGDNPATVQASEISS